MDYISHYQEGKGIMPPKYLVIFIDKAVIEDIHIFS